jgi:CO/xanthine dehydrogenase Mo-binding subunit
MGEFALGQPVSRFEDPRLLRGGGRYVDDMVLPRMVFGHVLRSPHAHARIRSIDTTKAKAAPGVLAVLTGTGWEASGWRDLPSASGTRGATAPSPIGRTIGHWSRIASGRWPRRPLGLRPVALPAPRGPAALVHGAAPPVARPASWHRQIRSHRPVSSSRRSSSMPLKSNRETIPTTLLPSTIGRWR